MALKRYARMGVADTIPIVGTNTFNNLTLIL